MTRPIARNSRSGRGRLVLIGSHSFGDARRAGATHARTQRIVRARSEPAQFVRFETRIFGTMRKPTSRQQWIDPRVIRKVVLGRNRCRRQPRSAVSADVAKGHSPSSREDDHAFPAYSRSPLEPGRSRVRGRHLRRCAGKPARGLEELGVSDTGHPEAHPSGGSGLDRRLTWSQLETCILEWLRQWGPSGCRHCRRHDALNDRRRGVRTGGVSNRPTKETEHGLYGMFPASRTPQAQVMR